MAKPVVMVTGSARRLGRQILLAFHRHGGFDLVLHFNESKNEAEKTAQLLKSEGGNVITVQGDISKRADVVRIMKMVEDRYGKLDILINNAAIFKSHSWDTIKDDEWDSIVDINLKGMFLCLQEGAKLIKRTVGEGRIINIASLGGLQAWKKSIPYSASKSGVISLTRTFARALAPDITVNAIAPGTIIIQGEENPKMEHIDPAKIPLKRYGKPKDITQLVLYLSINASYLTGVVIPVDGGLSIENRLS